MKLPIFCFIITESRRRCKMSAGPGRFCPKNKRTQNCVLLSAEIPDQLELSAGRDMLPRKAPEN